MVATMLSYATTVHKSHEDNILSLFLSVGRLIVRCQGRNCDFELKNGSGFGLQGFRLVSNSVRENQLRR